MNLNLRTEIKSALFSIHIKPASWSRYKILHSKAFQICPYPEPAKWIFTTGTKAWTKTQLFTQACKADKCNYAKRLRMWRLCGRKFSTLDSELVLTLNKVCSLLERSTESEKCLCMNIRCKWHSAFTDDPNKASEVQKPLIVCSSLILTARKDKIGNKKNITSHLIRRASSGSNGFLVVCDLFNCSSANVQALWKTSSMAFIM